MKTIDPAVGRFTSPQARERFLHAYDKAFAALWPDERTEYDIETSFGTTHVHRSGAENGEPVILLHGANSNAVQWYPFVQALGAQHPLYAIDTLGDPGRSRPTAAIHRPEDSAAWLDEVLKAQGIERAHVIGHSYGGWLALNQAARSPERLASVTALDPGGLQKVGRRFFAYLYLNAIAGLLPGRARGWAAQRLDNPVLVVPELRKVLMAAARTHRTKRPAPLPLDDAALAAIEVPLLILIGERSPLINPRTATERLHAVCPRAQVLVLPGVGHGPGFEHGSTVDSTLTDFIAAHRSH